jgi:hypothetical protein
MTDGQKLHFGSYARFRAEEARTIADQMTHEAARTIMRRGEEYDGRKL